MDSTKHPENEARSQRAYRRERFVHLLVLAICTAMLAGAAILKPAQTFGDYPSLAGHALPPMCMFKRTTGRDCPGCGLTRSWISGIHGQLSDSLRYHPLGLALMVYVALQALRHGLWLTRPALRPVLNTRGRWLDRGLVLLASALLLLWILRQFYQM